MPRIRLLTSVQGDGVVVGDAGDELDVDGTTARIWADGERAELVEAKRSVTRKGVARAVDRPA